MPTPKSSVKETPCTKVQGCHPQKALQLSLNTAQIKEILTDDLLELGI